MVSMALGILYHDILLLAALVFFFVFVMTFLGILAGKRGMLNLGRSLELLGGISMVIISVVIIMQYLKIL
jgi:putative Mn2+ efflux pump MntP